MANPSGIGASVRRREDKRFLTGSGTYTDDINRPGQTFACMVRSPHAHAAIGGIDTAAALAMPGVVAVYTGADMAATAQAHLHAPGLGVPVRPDKSGWDVLETASGVSLEQEMLKASEVSRQHNLDVGVVRSFHRMLMSAVRSGS